MARGVAVCTCSTCGNEFKKIKRNCFKSSDASSWEEWARNHYDECPDCYDERIKKERAAESEKAAEEAVKNNLPDLEGSEKQIAWALTIRKRVLEDLGKYESKFMEKLEKYRSSEKVERADQLEGIYVSIKNELVSQKSAKFWIEHREMNITSYIKIKAAEY